MLKTRTFLFALFALLALPSAASAATIVGPTNPNPDPGGSQAINWPNGMVLFTHSAPAGSGQLTAPADGVVTSWQLYTHEVGPGVTVQLRTLAPQGGKQYVVTGSGSAEPLREVKGQLGPEFHNVLNTFSARLPISAGQLVGVTLNKPETGSSMLPVLPYEAKNNGWSYGCLGCSAPLPPEGTPATASTVSEQWLAMNAKVEPDVDRDGYGDETQDACVGTCQPPAPQTVATPPAKKKCKKGKKLKRGKCVKKKRRKKPKK